MTREQVTNLILSVNLTTNKSLHKQVTDLFCFFVEYYGLTGDDITKFAEECGFPIAVNVVVL